MEQPVLTLDQTRLRAEPGGQAQLSVKLRNPGHLVESFRLDVVGLAPGWWQVHPPELPVYPGKEESAVVLLSPPAQAEAPDGALPFGVRAVSSLDPDRSVVEEGDLEVGRILDLQGEIHPVTSRARWYSTHRLTYTNWGNSASYLRLTVSDKDDALGFRLAPEQLAVPVGGTATARLRVRPRKPFMRGAPVHRPFQVVGEPAGSAPPPGTPRSAAARAGVPEPGRPVVDGAVLQLPILSRGVVVLAGLLVAAVAGLIVLSLKSGGVLGATQRGDVAPEAPTQLTADAVSATLIQLQWAPAERATGYQVLQLDKAGNRTNELSVPGLSTALPAKVDKPKTEICFQVVALRHTAFSQPSAVQCATTRDDTLDPPKDVKAVPDAAAFAVSWTDDQLNTHIILLDGSPLGQPIPPGVQKVGSLQVPAGHHCFQVLGQRGQNLSSTPSPDAPGACVDSGGPSPSTSPGAGQAGGSPATTSTSASTSTSGQGGGSGTTATQGNSGAPTGWVAVVGPPYQEQALAQVTLRRVQATGANAQIVQMSALPQFKNQSGLLVVATGFTSQAQAQQFCTTTVPPDLRSACQPLNASG
ncbi:MAG: COG1470 family protein [Kineosporiaceae bacterium]